MTGREYKEVNRNNIQQCIECKKFKHMTHFPYGATGIGYEFVCFYCTDRENAGKGAVEAESQWRSLELGAEYLEALEHARTCYSPNLMSRWREMHRS